MPSRKVVRSGAPGLRVAKSNLVQFRNPKASAMGVGQAVNFVAG